MKILMRRIAAIFLFIVIALCLAPTLIPPFLDHIYYRGPVSGHFDGKRFFNPGFENATHGGPQRFFNRWARGEDRAEWPAHVPVQQTVPPRQVLGNEMRVTWIGHASVLVQTAGINILSDPIWSERASPFSFAGPRRVREPGVRFEDLPKIHLILISHNHYDHLDLPTLKRLWARDRPQIVTSLGNDAILRAAGIPSLALDWSEGFSTGATCPPSPLCRPELEVVVLRNHHWSSRWGTDRNRALWSAFAVKLPSGTIFYAGDTGWGDGSWVREAARHGPFRLAIIPIGAYEPRDMMKDNHVDPAEAVAIYERLKPRAALGVHWGTFQLTFEGIDDPPRRLAALRRTRGIADNSFITTEVGRTFTVP